MEIQRAIKNLKEIIDLSKEEIENNDENTTAILDITDLKSLAIVLEALEQKDKEIQELKKYDIRNIKIDKDKIISSPSFTRKEVDLMNLGIALSLNADKLFNDESEEDDI